MDPVGIHGTKLPQLPARRAPLILPQQLGQGLEVTGADRWIDGSDGSDGSRVPHGCHGGFPPGNLAGS